MFACYTFNDVPHAVGALAHLPKEAASAILAVRAIQDLMTESINLTNITESPEQENPFKDAKTSKQQEEIRLPVYFCSRSASNADLSASRAAFRPDAK